MKKTNNNNDIDVAENICYTNNKEDPPSNGKDSADEDDAVQWVHSCTNRLNLEMESK